MRSEVNGRAGLYVPTGSECIFVNNTSTVSLDNGTFPGSCDLASKTGAALLCHDPARMEIQLVETVLNAEFQAVDCFLGMSRHMRISTTYK